MPDDQGSQKKNTIGDVQNLLGFLLVGFGAVLSFIGLRSTEVTTVLRNDPGQATVIALILLLGVLAAALTVAIDDSEAKKVSWATVVGVAMVLLGVGAFVIHSIPVGAAPGPASLVFGFAFGGVGGVLLVISWRSKIGVSTDAEKTAIAQEKTARAEERTARAREETARAEEKTAKAREKAATAEEKDNEEKNVALAEMNTATAEEKTARAEEEVARAQEEMARAQEESQGSQSGWGWLLAPYIPLTVIFILASVLFIAISAYGGMRLETDSQLSSSAQVAAGANTNSSGTMVSAHVTAYKIKDGSWVGITIWGLPSSVSITTACNKLEHYLRPNQATCQQDPCGPGPGRLGSECKIILNGTVAPDANGDVDDTLSVPLQPGRYQGIDVRAVICSSSMCQGVNEVTGSNKYAPAEGSRLDIVIPTPSASASPTDTVYGRG
jgi:VIT1/CCC1 family predicted Fe2+/Mn2+ transporter